MPASVVPVIYDHATKKVLRWYSLDFERQLADPAFNPQNLNERMIRVPLETYKSFGRTSEGHPALQDIQNHVNAVAP